MWVQAGQPSEKFGTVTFRELQIVVEASARRDARQAWLAAQYAAFAYHAPNEMPPDPTNEKPQETVDPEILEEIRAIRRQVQIEQDAKRAQKAKVGLGS